jgi:diguanylate cyclase (GGDEF)-like protein/PAS domain S-box-containing protein
MQLYGGILRNLDFGVFTVGLDGRFLDANVAMARMLGYADPAEMLGESGADVPLCDVECLRRFEELRGKADAQRPVTLETRYIRPDGEGFWARMQLQRVRTAEGAEVVVGLVEDVSRSRETLDALERAERQYRLLFDLAADAIFVHDEEGVIHDANQVACDRLGYHRRELVGRNMAELETERYARESGDQFARLRAYGQLAFLTEQRRSDGTVLSVEINSRLAEVDGVRLALSIARDMTEFFRVQDALRASLANVEKQVEERTRELSVANRQLLREIEGRKRYEEKLAASEEKYRTLVETTDTGFMILDREGTVLDANPRYVELTGRIERGEVLGRTVFEWTAEHDRQRSREALERGFATGALRDFQVDYVRPDGSLLPVEINAAVVQGLGGRQLHNLCRDIRARRENEREIRTLTRAVEQSPASVIITDPQGHIEYVNSKFTEVTGYTEAEVLGKSPGILKSGEMSHEFYQDLWRILASGKEWRGEFCNRNKRGDIFWESASISPVFDPAGKLVHFVAVKEDITEQRTQQERIRKLALFDPLTGLPNRALFMDRLSHSIARMTRTGRKLALLFIDLNKFKPVNDTFGHHVGDLVLQDVARRIAESVREADTAARLGGDEFVALLHDVEDKAQVERVAQRIIDRIDGPYHHCDGNACPQVGASIGIALCPEHARTVDGLIRAADAAMYQVKQTGMSGFAYAEPLKNPR